MPDTTDPAASQEAPEKDVKEDQGNAQRESRLIQETNLDLERKQRREIALRILAR
jgi:hypothetical protein